MIPAILEAGEYLRQGGAVIPPLIAVSVAMWYFILKKLVQLRNSRPFLPPEERRGDRKRMMATVRSRQRDLDRHVGTVLVLAAVAPLLGLLGTVMGMIGTFDAIARFGASDARAFAAGISEALITTQFGLIVAIPGLFMGNLIRRRVLTLQEGWERLLIRRTVLARSLPPSGIFQEEEKH